MTQSSQLSEREKEVVQHLLQGKTNKQIAKSLSISDRTVEFHLKNIYAKSQVSSRIELILQLGNSTGNVLSEKLGHSTVENREEKAENRDGYSSPMDLGTVFRETVSTISQESIMKNHGTLYIASGILWATAIIAAAVVGAPTVLSVVLLPTLAVAALFVMESTLKASASDV